MAEASEKEEQHWEEMRRLMEDGGAHAVLGYILRVGEAAERRPIHEFAQKAFGRRDWKGKNFDDRIELARGGIGDILWNSLDSGDPTLVRECKDLANRLSYNLSADLAECWPGDEEQRERRHLEAGRRAAWDCILWRLELGKPPERRAMAYWALGMHQLSLGSRIEALGAFETALRLAAEATNGEGSPSTPSAIEAAIKPGADFGLVLYWGYTGIVKRLLGDEAGGSMLESACGTFEKTAASFPDQKEDAMFGFGQLRWVERRFLMQSPSS